MSFATTNSARDFCIVLVRPRNPLNIGAVARAMANFGCSRLRVVEPYEPSWREARSAVGAADILANAQVYPTVAEAIADRTLAIGTTAATNRNPSQPLISLPDLLPRLATAGSSAKIAILFGSEKRGLANDDLSHCHWLLRIPTTTETPSMNLAQSVVVVLYELSRTPHTPIPDEQAAPATMQTLQRLADLMHDSLTRSGYYSDAAQVSSGEQLRQLLTRIALTDSDAATLTGMFRQILWRLRQPPSK